MATPVPFTPLIIDGQERPSANSESFPVHTPQSGQLAGTAASATSQDCRDAIDAAARALVSWEKTRPAERRNIFLKAADILASERWIKLLKEANQQEVAFAPHWSTFDSMGPSNNFRAQAGLVDKLRGEFYPSINVPGVQVHVQPRAKGVLYVFPISGHRSVSNIHRFIGWR
jgi:acyl-CoA reductase-like NAD-dependent aldehyde dehydrogenase